MAEEKGKKLQDNEKEAFWHSTAHVLADAVKRIWPDVKLALGPAIKEGFYYDFDKKESFTAEDLTKIEEEMKKIIKQNLKFEKVELSRKDAEDYLKKNKETYRLEFLKDLPDKKVSFYKHGDFQDMCKGPHIRYTKQIKALKLLNATTAYWKGDSNNAVLQRIYGISFPSKAELEEYLIRVDEAKKRDHNVLGRQLDLFGIYPETVGPGLAHWHPKGAIMRQIIENFWHKEHIKRGYMPVYTPHIGYKALWETSGHLNFYKDSMYNPMKIDENEYYIKPMNCPFHIQIYKSKSRSYRDLPYRTSELGTVYRYELSGALHGLTRVRGFTQDDSHIFCTPDQVNNEIDGVLDLGLFLLKSFGFEKYNIYLSVRNPKNKSKYLGTDKMWDLAEKSLAKALDKRKLKYTRDEGEAVFYGPKIDIKLIDSIGREWQCTTIQFDFNLAEKFDINYIGEDGKKHRVYMIHRALLGSLERFFGMLIEHYAGAFPVWLSPVQVKILTIADRHDKYAEQLKKELLENDIRVEVDASQNTTDYKIREAELEKVPYIIVVGDKEEQKKTLAVRTRGNKKIDYGIKTKDLIQEIQKKVEKKE